MLKIFTTQLNGYLRQYEQKEEFEDAARLLAQALISHNNVWIYGSKEMQSVVNEAKYGEEPLPNMKELTVESLNQVGSNDRVLLFTRLDTDEEAIDIAQKLYDEMIPTVVVTTVVSENSTQSIAQYADLLFDLKLKKGLLPSDTGERFLYPSSLLALYVYFGITITTKDILSEFDTE